MRWILVFLLVGGVLSASCVCAEELAWQTAGRYVAPDFEGFFPDDIEGGNKLDEEISAGLPTEDARELLEIVRQGLRRATVQRETILEVISKRFIWRLPSQTEPQNPYAIELMYHASGSPEFRDDAFYYGLQVVRGKTGNVLRALMDYGYENVDRSVWGIQTYDDPNQVAARLEALLEKPDKLSADSALTGYAIYRGITGHAPPHLEQFNDLGSFVIVFEREGIDIDHAGEAAAAKESFGHEFGLTDELIDLTRRINRGKVQEVALVRGVPTYDRLVEELPQRTGYSLVFSHRHLVDDRYSLPEFQHYISDGEKQSGPAWAEQVAEAKAQYAWNRTDSYVPPGYEAFFPDDVEGGRALDELVAKRADSTLLDREILEVARRGWRHTTVNPQTLMGWLGERFTRWPENPYAIEFFYHTLGAPTTKSPSCAGTAIYFCFVNLPEKPPNVLHALGDLYVHSDPFGDLRNDIMRSFRTEREKQYLADLFLKALENYESAPPLETISAYQGYRELTGKMPPNAAEVGGIGRFVVVFRRNGVTTSDELLKRFAEEHAADATILEIRARMERNEVSGVALVDGIAELNRLIEALTTDSRYSLDAAVPLTPRLVEGEDGIPEFRQYLEPAHPSGN